MANSYYSTEFKKMATELVCISKQSTIKTAKDLNIPLKTLEKWITAYNKDNKSLILIIFLLTNKYKLLKRELLN